MAFKMVGKGPMMKALIGKQHNLPEELKAKIESAPESPLNNKEDRLKRQGENSDANELVEKRTKLKDKKKKREEQGKGTKFIDNRIDNNQERINNNPEAIEWKHAGESRSPDNDPALRTPQEQPQQRRQTPR
jgi:hypothetical protein